MPSLFPQNVIAVIWDFDKTLIPGYMQQPIFDHYGVEAVTFWNEANGLKEFYAAQGLDLVSPDTLYLTHMLTYVEEGIFDGLNNSMMRDFGRELTFCEGIPDFLPRLKRVIESDKRYASHEIALEHYIVSTGLREVIRGSAVSEHVESVWACEFVEHLAPSGYLSLAGQLELEQPSVIRAVGYSIDNTTKTRAVFEINKGTNKFPDIEVNASIPESERRVPFKNMIYVADGPSDIPVFSLVTRFGGMTYGVFDPASVTSFDDLHDLLEKRRVQGVGPFDYSPGSQAEMWLSRAVKKVADRIVAEREGARAERVGKPRGHIVEPVQSVTRPSRDESRSTLVPLRAVPQLVEDLLARTGVVAAPVPLEPILRELHIELSAREQQQEEAVVVPLTDPADGTPTAWQVFYNPNRPERRRRFTVAHEVGHVVLHGSSHGAASARGGGGSRTREREADAFAAELLMPSAFVRSAVSVRGVNVDDLADHFEVSADAMRVRLKELGFDPGTEQTASESKGRRRQPSPQTPRQRRKSTDT